MQPNLPPQPESFFDRFNRWLSRSVTIRLLSVGFLILILMIPNAMVRDLITERQNTNEQAVNEVSESWGREQTLTGPYLSLPYKQFFTDKNGNETVSEGHFHLLPDLLDVQGTLKPEVLKRGIFKVVVYGSEMTIKAKFTLPDLTQTDNKVSYDLDHARLCMGIPDMRGIRDRLVFTVNGTPLECGPGLPNANVAVAGVSVVLPGAMLSPGGVIETVLPLRLNGSRAFNFIPLGKETVVNLNSSWPSPSFYGSFLPEDRSITQQGFTARWRVFDLNRNFAQSWFDDGQNVSAASFGVRLMRPVDHYTLNNRSAKYAIMVIALTFVVYFFIESLNRKRIHPMQYILVGLALSVFFLLLLSLSEHLGFNASFSAAALATTALITIYSRGVFDNTKLAAFMGGLLTVLYGFIFTILQLEDVALLVGSIGLFMVLAVVMVYSRKVDWYALGNSDSQA